MKSDLTLDKFLVSLTATLLLLMGVMVYLWSDTNDKIEGYANDIQRLKYYLYLHGDGEFDTKLVKATTYDGLKNQP